MKRSLGRKQDNLNHLIRNLATSLLLYEAIETTREKAKETKAYTERIIARSKKANTPERRKAYASLFDKNAAKKLFAELLPRYADRNSGFIRTYHLKNRAGDDAEMMRLELVDMKKFVAEAKTEDTKSATNKKPENKTETKTKTKVTDAESK